MNHRAGYPPPQQGRAQTTYTPPPKARRATVAMTIDVLVEVEDTGSYNDMVSQAIEELRKRVVEAPTFLPVRMKSDRIYNDVKVQELKSALIVEPGVRWNR